MFFVRPTEPCDPIEKTLYARVVSYLMLYCSQRPAFPVETSQSRGKREVCKPQSNFFGLQFKIVGFYTRSSRERQEKFTFIDR